MATALTYPSFNDAMHLTQQDALEAKKYYHAQANVYRLQLQSAIAKRALEWGTSALEAENVIRYVAPLSIALPVFASLGPFFTLNRYCTFFSSLGAYGGSWRVLNNDLGDIFRKYAVGPSLYCTVVTGSAIFQWGWHQIRTPRDCRPQFFQTFSAVYYR